MKKSKFIKTPKKVTLQPAQYGRPLNAEETGLSLVTSASVHYLIQCLDKLKETTLFSGPLKYKANMFQEELLRHAKVTVWDVSAGEGVDTYSAMEQMEGISMMFHNLLMTCMAIGSLHPGQHSLFWLAMNKEFIAYKMPIAIGPDGYIQYIDEKKEGGEV